MPNCSRCSHTLTSADRFCPNCGAPSDTDVTSAETMAAKTASHASDSSSLGHGRFEPGHRLGSRYRMVGMLGRGGMGEVYRADDLELGQSVALKFLPDRLRHEPSMLSRFRAEVRLARQIAHPNVARVYDIAEADGQIFLSMEYVDGEDLASVLRRMGRPSKDKAVEIARQLCLGLAAAHERGVLHRDLKPSNVMIDGRGGVRIMDFGLAAIAGDPNATEIVGTPAYMAPEQLTAGVVSVQSDVYALGLVMWELFTGKRANDTSDPAELRRRAASGSMPTPSSVVSDLDPVIERLLQRCLDPDPRLRPPSAYAVLGALPGGDPLAAALAAGETPSPELVAHAGEAGGLAPWQAAALLAVTIVACLVATWLGAPSWRSASGAPAMLAFKAQSALETLGYDALPKHTASGFSARRDWATRLAKRKLPVDSLAGAGPGGYAYWRRYAPRRLQPLDIHSNVSTLTDPPQSGPGSVTVMLDMRGRLIGLEAAPTPDSATHAPGAGGLWAPVLALAGLDSTALAPDPRPWVAPVGSDSIRAWTMPAPTPGRSEWHVRAAASRGRIVYFAIADSVGAAIDPVHAPAPDAPWDAGAWISFVFWVLLNAGEIWLAARNLKLGRGDPRGAFRLAAFVFVATAMESVFTWNSGENGLQGLIGDLLSDAPLGHALVHAGQMWVAYVAIEPYVRRLWPRMLVSWARLTSGRTRDPMVGRDLLMGLAIGAVGTVASLLAWKAMAALHLPATFLVPNATDLAALASPAGLGFQVSYAGSVMVLSVLIALVTCLLVHLVTRNDRGTFFVAGAIQTGLTYLGGAGPLSPLPIVESVVPTVALFVSLFRFGLLTAFASLFMQMVLSVTPPVFGDGATFGARGVTALALLSGLALYGAWAALAGRPLIDDVLDDRRPGRTQG